MNVRTFIWNEFSRLADIDLKNYQSTLIKKILTVSNCVSRNFCVCVTVVGSVRITTKMLGRLDKTSYFELLVLLLL